MQHFNKADHNICKDEERSCTLDTIWRATCLPLVPRLYAQYTSTASINALTLKKLHQIYWLSWYSTFVVFFLLVACVYAVLAPALTTIKFFDSTDWLVHVLIAWSYMCSFGALAMFFTSFLTKPRSILGVQIFLLAVPVVFNDQIRDFGHNPYTFPEVWPHRSYHPDNKDIYKVGLGWGGVVRFCGGGRGSSVHDFGDIIKVRGAQRAFP